ncbi:MAG: hypothetical protein Q8L08_00445 [Candidatus Nanopelagicaceae bacterium]|nr:hypothetical protein [Candidatus Nanopelagicaceae bacterium]
MKPKSQLSMAPVQRTELTKFLSGGRMNSYLAAVPTTSIVSFDEFDLYVYNMALAGAYLGPIHLLEVVTRNAMHTQMAIHAGQSDWWNSSRISLLKWQLSGIDAAKTKLAKERSGPSSVPFTADDVVAALDFGFWCGLLGRGISRDARFDYDRFLWQPALRHAFPGNRANRDDLYSKMDAARRLRNRVGHHEPIHGRDQEKEYQKIFRLLSYVSPPIAQWMDDRSRLLSEVAAFKPGNVDAIAHF